MKTYSDPEILTRYPEPCAIAESYGFESVLLLKSASLQYPGNMSIDTEPVKASILTFYLEVPDDFENRCNIPILEHALLPDGQPNGWQLATHHTLSSHYISRGFYEIPRQLGYARKTPPYFSTKGLQPLRYLSQLVEKMGYSKTDTAALLALYERHVGAAYLSATDVHAPLPDKKTARRLLHEMGEIWRYPELTRAQKIDFVTRRGNLTELNTILSTGTPYTLAAEVFPHYQENHHV